MRRCNRVAEAIVRHKTRVIDLDLRAYFDNVRHHRLLQKVATRVNDDDVMHLLKMMLTATGKKGVPQGGVISPLLSNIYLTEVDRMLERAKEVTRHGKYTALEYARFADDLVILVDAYRRHDWLVRAVNKRLREEFAKLEVEVNEEKTRLVDLTKDECFGFLGFDFRRVQSLNGTWRAQFTPKLKKRTALLHKLADVFKHSHSQPAMRVVERINPIVRGWVNYFAIGHSAPVLLLRPRLGRDEDAAASAAQPAAQGLRLAPAASRVAVWHAGSLWGLPRAVLRTADRRASSIGLITLGVKRTGKLLAGDPHEQFDVAGVGNGLPEHRACPRPYPRTGGRGLCVHGSGSVHGLSRRPYWRAAGDGSSCRSSG